MILKQRNTVIIHIYLTHFVTISHAIPQWHVSNHFLPFPSAPAPCFMESCPFQGILLHVLLYFTQFYGFLFLFCGISHHFALRVSWCLMPVLQHFATVLTFACHFLTVSLFFYVMAIVWTYLPRPFQHHSCSSNGAKDFKYPLIDNILYNSNSILLGPS